VNVGQVARDELALFDQKALTKFVLGKLPQHNIETNGLVHSRVCAKILCIDVRPNIVYERH
jgi:hypothetical protein